MNRLNNLFNAVSNTKLVLLFLVLGSAIQVNAQDRLPFDQGKTYILKKVSVTGKITYNE